MFSLINNGKGRAVAKIKHSSLSVKGVYVYLYEDKKDIDEHTFTKLDIHDGYFQQLPNTHTRDAVMIAGPSGSGKSTYCKHYIKEYRKIYKKNEAYMFSRVDSDPSLREKDIKRFIIDEGLITDPIQTKDLDNSLVIFDDIDTIPDKRVTEKVRQLRDDILETGRHNNIYTISTSHQLMNYKTTRTLLNESTSVTFFPKSGSSYHIKRFLREYCGLSSKKIIEILNLPSRWVTVSKIYPMFILYETGIELLSV